MTSDVGNPFSKVKSDYKVCTVIKFEEGSVFASELSSDKVEACDINAVVSEIGTYSPSSDGILVDVADSKFELSKDENSTKRVGRIAEKTDEVSVRIDSGEGSSVTQRVLFIDTTSKSLDKFHSNTVTVPSMAKVPRPTGGYWTQINQDIWYHKNIEATASYNLEGSPSLSLVLNHDCKGLKLDNRNNAVDSPIAVQEAHSNTGVKVSAFTVVEDVAAATCTYNFDLTGISTEFLTEDSYFDITLNHQPKANYFMFTSYGISLGIFNQLNYAQTYKVRVNASSEI